MKITYYVGKIDSLFRKHEPKPSIREVDTTTLDHAHCFVYMNDVFVFSYPHDDMWLQHWQRRPKDRNIDKVRTMFERWIRLKIRCLQRTQPSA